MNAQAGGDPAKTAEADNALTGTLKSLFALSEAYSDLKANQSFLQLQEKLGSTENRVATGIAALQEVAGTIAAAS